MKKQSKTNWFAKMNNGQDSKPPTLYLIGSPEDGIWLTKEQMLKALYSLRRTRKEHRNEKKKQ